MHTSPTAGASRQPGTHPRPQLLRDQWVDLSGPWGFSHDDENRGIDERWFDERWPDDLNSPDSRPVDAEAADGGAPAGIASDGVVFDREILVPYAPESLASGIHDTGFHPVVWYRRMVTNAELVAAGLGTQGSRVWVRLGAVDYRASVWLDGSLLGTHEGGHTPFGFDLSPALDATRDIHSLVVRAEDDPADVGQPRGKQDWQLDPHAVWYHRTTGIWQPVWLEAVPDLSITHVAWRSDLADASVELSVEFSRRPRSGRLAVSLALAGEQLASLSLDATSDRVRVRVPLDRAGNGQDYEQLLWSPDHPRLLDATITVTDDTSSDTVGSYLGLRSVAVGNGSFHLNDRPIYLRSVLSQGYWPESQLSASADQLRAEVQLILDLGFNAARVHQKIEDPRFLYWADRLGLMLWAEMPSSYEFSPTAVRRATAEWCEVLHRDSSHPSIVTWVPLNESWGVQHIAVDVRAQDYARALRHLTLALDPTRPVVSNDGWEHVDTDIWTIHDYESDAAIVRERYTDAAALTALVAGTGPAGRSMAVATPVDRQQPVMLTEFGGVKFTPASTESESESETASWGYSTANSEADYAVRLGSLFEAVSASTALAGFCYTQLTDTGQEVNGLVAGNRRPKLPIDDLRSLVTGDAVNPT